MLEEEVASALYCSDKRSLTSSITLSTGTCSFLSGLVLYGLDLLPTVTSSQGGKSRSCSSDSLEYAFLFVRSWEMSVGGRWFGSVDLASGA